MRAYGKTLNAERSMLNARMRRGIVLAIVAGLAGCQLPQWRVFQAKVPEPVKKNEVQVETDRRAADLIARKIEKPVELKPVAVGLSESLGKPERMIEGPKAAETSVEELRFSVVKTQEMVKKQNELLTKFAGREIEGTGLNLFGPGMGVVVIGLVVLGVMCPPAATAIFFLLRRTGSALKQTVASIEQFSKEEPVAAERLKDLQSKAMDKAHKELIKRVKVKL